MPDSQSQLLDRLKTENADLRRQLSLQQFQSAEASPLEESAGEVQAFQWEGCGLTGSQVSRYSRQLVLPSFGPQAQAKLCDGSVLIIGAGGLGSPAALYLAAAGVGRLGIVDTDALELSNLHRQIAHQEASVGMHKAASAAASCRALNSSIQVVPHLDGLLPQNALELVRAYDVVLDASDNAPTRYLASDACCVADKPLVSGAALGMDGQLTTLCVSPDGPCYRCLYPEAPALASCRRCGEAGVLGVAPGIIGTLQALEAIKLLAGIGQPLKQRLLLLDCLSTGFRSIKLRHRQRACVSCGDHATITASNVADYDYQAFTGQPFNDAAPPSISLIPAAERIHVQDLASRLGLNSNSARAQAHPPGMASIPVQSRDHAPSISSASPGSSASQENLSEELSRQTDQNGAAKSPASTRPSSLANGMASQNLQSSSTERSQGPSQPLLIDVRPKEQFLAAHLPGSISVPYQGPHKPLSEALLQICQSHPAAGSSADQSKRAAVNLLMQRETAMMSPSSDTSPNMHSQPMSQQPDSSREIIVVCRRGNDSQEVVHQLRQKGITQAVDVAGGLTAWSRLIDPSFPHY